MNLNRLLYTAKMTTITMPAEDFAHVRSGMKCFELRVCNPIIKTLRPNTYLYIRNRDAQHLPGIQSTITRITYAKDYETALTKIPFRLVSPSAVSREALLARLNESTPVDLIAQHGVAVLQIQPISSAM